MVYHRVADDKGGHPMERMLLELGTVHRYTRPCRPQTNGKVERFWRMLDEDLLDGTTFESVEELKEECRNGRAAHRPPRQL